MKKLGAYCKAYPIAALEQFAGWHAPTNEPKDFLYLQDSYVVTHGIYQDEAIVFDHITPEWKAFCTDVLAFAPTTINSAS